MFIWERIYRQGEKLCIKIFKGKLFFRENYYSADEIIVIIGDMCSRMSPLNNSICFTLDY